MHCACKYPLVWAYGSACRAHSGLERCFGVAFLAPLTLKINDFCFIRRMGFRVEVACIAIDWLTWKSWLGVTMEIQNHKFIMERKWNVQTNGFLRIFASNAEESAGINLSIARYATLSLSTIVRGALAVISLHFHLWSSPPQLNVIACLRYWEQQQ